MSWLKDITTILMLWCSVIPCKTSNQCSDCNNVDLYGFICKQNILLQIIVIIKKQTNKKKQKKQKKKKKKNRTNAKPEYLYAGDSRISVDECMILSTKGGIRKVKGM